VDNEPDAEAAEDKDAEDMNALIFLMIFITITLSIVVFMIVNTIMGAYLVPTFNQVNISLGGVTNMNQFNYDQKSIYFQSILFIAIFIIMAIPFLYLYLRVFRTEPESYGVGG
jgi:hypothetical protein